jgi:hypothetical protein
VAGGTTTLTVEIRDASGNFISTDNATVVTFTPTLSGTISDVPAGVLMTPPVGTPGTAETVTVVNGVAVVTLTDTVVEAFTVNIASGLTTNPPAAGPVNVTHATPSQVVITLAAVDFAAGGNADLEVETRDAYGNTATTDNATLITFDPTLSGTISGVVTGTGDGGYGAVGGAEDVTVANGVARITLTDTVAETFEVAFTSLLVDPR